MKSILKVVGLVISTFYASTSSAGLIELVSNGGFESGNFAGWSVSNTGSGGCGVNDWTVNSAGTHGCSGLVGVMPAPSGGSFAAYNTFDGPATNTYYIAQQISVGSNVIGGSLSFLDTVRWSGPQVRTLSIDLFDSTNTALVANLFTQGYSAVNQGWSSKNADVTAQLLGSLGQTRTIRVSTIIPISFTGPAGFGIDNISLQARTADVPVPATLALLGLGLAGLGWKRRKH